MDEYKNTVRNKVAFFCLLAAGLIEALSIIQLPFLNYPETYVVETYLIVPCAMFFGAALMVKQDRKSCRELLIGLVCVTWFALLQVLHQITEQGARNLGFFASALLLAYPYSAVTDDCQRRRGLRLMGWLFTGAAVLLCLGGLMLKLEVLPANLGSVFFWDGVRLHAARHPNITACVLMIAIAFCLSQVFRFRTAWAKFGLSGLTVVFFCFQALTNGRTAIMLTSGMIALISLLPFYRKNWKRLLLILVAGAVLTLGLYTGATALFYRNEAALKAAFYAQQAETRAEPSVPLEPQLEVTQETQPVSPASAEAPASEAAPTSGDRALEHQLRDLNGRLPTWKAAINALADNPSLLLTGKHYVGETLSYYRGSPIEHAHNSFLEITLWLGLPGVVMALYISFLVLRGGLRVLLSDGDMEEKCIALLPLCLLACSLLEPILFTGNEEYHFLNFVFFLCGGYLEQWGRLLRNE